MKNISLSKKILVMAFATIVILAIELTVIFISNSNINRISDELAIYDIPLLDRSHKIKLAVVQVQQWLTDISATRGLDGLNDGFDEAKKNADLFYKLINELHSINDQSMEYYGHGLLKDVDTKEFLNNMKQKFDTYFSVGKNMAQVYIDAGPAGGNKVMDSFDKAAAALASEVDALLDKATSNSNKALTQQITYVDNANINVSISSVILLIIITILFTVLTGVIKALPRISKAMEVIAQGDLSGPPFICKEKNELGQLATGLNGMKDSLKGVLNEMSLTSDELFTSVEKLTVATHETEQGMKGQLNEIN